MGWCLLVLDNLIYVRLGFAYCCLDSVGSVGLSFPLGLGRCCLLELCTKWFTFWGVAMDGFWG